MRFGPIIQQVKVPNERFLKNLQTLGASQEKYDQAIAETEQGILSNITHAFDDALERIKQADWESGGMYDVITGYQAMLTVWLRVYYVPITESRRLWEIPGVGMYFDLGARAYSSRYTRGMYDKTQNLIFGIHELTDEELLVLVRGSTDEDVDNFLKAIDSIEAKPEPEPPPNPVQQADTTVGPTVKKRRFSLHDSGSDGTMRRILTGRD